MMTTTSTRRQLFASVLAAGISSALPALTFTPARGQTAVANSVNPVLREGLWVKMHENYLAQARKGHIDLLFLGDSITQGWNNNTVWQRY